MERIICAAAAAALVFVGTAALAQDGKKTAGKRSSFRDIQIECWKQNGGWYDEANKRWTIQVPYYHMGGKSDAINACIAARTGKSGNYVQEQTYRP